MADEKSCGAIVFTYEGGARKYVIVRGTGIYQGFCGFPKGHMEDGESEQDTALREVREETGLDVRLIDGFRQEDEHFLAREGRPNDKKTNVYFLAEYHDQELRAQESEVSEIVLLNYDEAMQSLQLEDSKRELAEAERYLNEHMKKVFEYGKCVFTRLNVDNADDMVEMMNNEKISSMLSVRKRTITREAEIEWINAHQEDEFFSVYDRDTMEYIGNCSYNEIDGKRGEIGLNICEHMQGKHYAKDIITGLAEYGFRELGLDEVYGIIFSDNIRSLTCVTQLGFEEYARDKGIFERNGIPVDDVYFRLKNRH
jgi:RimJ/RimL family protein N-acetyltransferase/ADP-ribose pyrophosphatase YjhB (NUDIX family)